MGLLTSLLKAYDYSLENGLVNQHDGNTIILPLYHTNLESKGNNVLQVNLNKDGTLFSVEWVPADDRIVFPITENSIARSGKNPPAHPLVDKMEYIVPSDSSKHQNFRKEFENWLNWMPDTKNREYLEVVNTFINRTTMFNDILEKLFNNISFEKDGFKISYIEETGNKKEKIKTIDFSKVFLTYQIMDFQDIKNVSVTVNTELHQSFIEYIDETNPSTGICNLSGEEQRITTKHRGLLGNAKLISISNNKETYYGRFKNGSSIIKVGYKTSEKIHLMLKYFLENSNSKKWLNGQQYLINWFSDDINNKTELDLMNFNPFAALIVEDEDKKMDNSSNLVTTKNKEIGNYFALGNKELNLNENYYAAIIDKASNGRISIKYFRELKNSQLVNNLNKWVGRYTWEFYDPKTQEYRQNTPGIYRILLASYGVERNSQLQLDNDSFKKDQLQKILTALIDGSAIPKNIVKALKLNIRNRINYRDTWNQVLYTSLAVLSNEEGGHNPMLDKENTNRSYLFGRLLAVFEAVESSTYKDDKRVTNAQKYWSSYTNQPATMMKILIEKTNIYKDMLLKSSRGLYIKYNREMENIITHIEENYLSSENLNKSLDYNFIFGYYAERKYLYTKNDEKVEVIANDK